MKQHRKMFQYVEEMLTAMTAERAIRVRTKLNMTDTPIHCGFISGCSALRES